MIKLKASVETIAQASTITASGFSVHQSVVSPDFTTEFVSDLIGKSKITVNNLYREIFLYDGVAGTTVSLFAMLPWSDYSVVVDDPKIKKIYEDCLAEIDIQEIQRQLATVYLVFGRAVATLLFSEKKGYFTDVIPHNIDDCIITPIPLVGYNPKIDLKVSDSMRKFLRSTDPRDREALTEIPPKLFGKLLKGKSIPLEPLNTVYLARETVPGISDGISFYSRILPLWLIEKALIRGTIIGAWRRQRSILHITVGDEEWEATPEQLSAIADMFIQADQDPQGAVVATRNGISTDEVRAGGDFWKFSDEWDTLMTAKMRALGISEALLSGEATYSTTEHAISSFLENLRSFRDYLTKSVIYDKIFLLLSKYHNFVKRTKAELTHRVRLSAKKDLSSANRFIIPKINWSKSLSPRVDTDYMDALSSLRDTGIPVPWGLYAQTVGLTLEEIHEHLKNELEIRKNMANLLKKMPKTSEEEGGGGVFSFVIPETVLTGKQASNILKSEGRKIVKDRSVLAPVSKGGKR